jgi:hypothetical protein
VPLAAAVASSPHQPKLRVLYVGATPGDACKAAMLGLADYRLVLTDLYTSCEHLVVVPCKHYTFSVVGVCYLCLG